MGSTSTPISSNNLRINIKGDLFYHSAAENRFTGILISDSNLKFSGTLSHHIELRNIQL